MTASLARPIASGWRWRALGDCAQLINGRAYAQHELLSSGTPVIRIQNLNGGDRWYYSDLSLPDDKYCSAGDLLFAWSASFGPYIWTGPRSIFHYHIWRVVPGDELDKAFAYHLLDWITAKVKAASHGVAMLHMTKGGMEAWQVPVPPLAEQRRIAEVLDRAEALRTKRRAALAQLDALTQSIFSAAFGDPIKNPNGYPIQPMIELIDPARPLSYGILMPGPSLDDGIKYVRVVDMKRGGIDLTGIRKTTPEISNAFRRSLLRPGDLLMSIRGHVGRLAVVPSELDGANITQDTARMAIQGMSPVFVRELLRSPGIQRWMERHTKGVAVRGINLGDIKKLPVIIPPRAEQDKFASRADAVDSLQAAQRASLAELDALFASLQHRAFRGEL